MIKLSNINPNMKTLTSLLTVLIVLASSYNNETVNNNAKDTSVKQSSDSTAVPPPLREKVLTAEEQKALTPDMVIQSLKDGNRRFMINNVTARDHLAMVRNAATGQYPKAVILSCLDSRIPVEDVFDKGIGDLFVARVAGNFVNTDIPGSMEFGCKVSGARLILLSAMNPAVQSKRPLIMLTWAISPACLKYRTCRG
jgi:carbonic anhydrase